MTNDTAVIPVKVAVRIRPFDCREKEQNAQQCLQYCLKRNEVSDTYLYELCRFVDYNKRSNIFVRYGIRCSCNTGCRLRVMCSAAYRQTIQRWDLWYLLSNWIDLVGYNCTVFAYGQTSSGKTYTMGTEQTTDSMGNTHQGIIPQMVSNIFDYIEQNEVSNRFSVSCSMLEVGLKQIKQKV
jgi:hypothetical protein